MKNRLFPLILVLIIILSTGSGCALFQIKEERYAQELASDGMESYQEGKYKNAIESFEKLKDWYPFSKYAILAELKIADSHYKLKEYEEAVSAYEQFENLHPLNDAIPHIIFQIGLCYFEQVDTPDRDQTTARKALEAFNRLIKQFPNNTYAAKAREYTGICYKSLGESELEIGVFYYKSKHYKAALERFKSVIINYPDVGVHQKALQYIALCETSLSKQK
ncbi:MAG: outer membrane protein assembly factor BamD [Pseudomonadota bacterium]